MKSKSFIFLFVLIFIMVFSLSAVCADDLQSADSGVVSGDVVVESVNPGTTSGELTYDIPADADIKQANVYVNVYSGSAQNTYGANANVSLNTVNGENQIASEELWIENGSSDGAVYPLGDHINKCYSDYQMYYDVTDSLKGLNGSSISIKVDTFAMDGKLFDGRIKLIALVLAYDDGDLDIMNYYIDSSQRWTKTNVTTTFETGDLAEINHAELVNIALSSTDGSFMVNGNSLAEPINHTSGGFNYQYNCWDVTENMQLGNDTEFVSANAGTSSYSSLKDVLSVLKVNSGINAPDVSFKTEYTSVPTCYAGTNNTVTVTVNANKRNNFTVELLADGVVVNSTEVEVDGERASTFALTDPTVRDLNETTVKGANNNMVVYSVNVKYDNEIVNSVNKTLPILYNGYLGYDKEYGVESYLNSFQVITGDIVLDVKDVSSYLGASDMGRTDVWTVNLDENSEIAAALLIIPYNWFNPNIANETEDMFDLTFNGEEIEVWDFYRDQGNLGNYGGYGYGFISYDVCNLLNTSGDNTLVLNKKFATPAVYPSVLFYMYNTEGGTFKEVTYLAGMDLLANSYNNAGRTVKSDSDLILDEDYVNVTLYVLAASAQAGEGNIIVNGEEFVDVWDGTSSTTDLFVADITDVVAEDTNISFVATGSTIVALPQFVVADLGYGFGIDSIKTEYTSVPTAYAGTNNTLTVTVTTDIAGEFVVDLWANLQQVDSVLVNLTEGANTVLLTDPTIRPIDEYTVNGADNDEVLYIVDLTFKDYIVSENITVPVLYNGNLGYDMEYPGTGFNSYNQIIAGDFAIDVKDESSYLGATDMNRTDVWTINLDQGNDIVESSIIIPYNWFNAKLYNETWDMFDVTFNGETLTPSDFYRDQSNLGNYGKYGYGVLVYDVTDLLNTSGDNTLVLNKKYATPAVYPSVLYYAYNVPGASFKEFYFIVGADLLANTNNVAGRPVKSDIEIELAEDNPHYENVTLYVLAASAQAGEGNIIVNGNEFVDVWSGTSKTTDLFTADITDLVTTDDTNISFVGTGSTILALPQFIVADIGYSFSIDSIKTEYTSVPTCYAGTNNTITVTITSSVAGEFEIELWADAHNVDSIVVNLTEGTNTVVLTDPTIRPIDEYTVNGADNDVVCYSVVAYYDEIGVDNNITVPVLYNGNLGKDYEYPGADPTVRDYSFAGDVIVLNGNEYSAGAKTTRTDNFTVDLNDGSVEEALLYVSYNWDKIADGDFNYWNTTFNNQVIAPIASYRDQGNLGNYGKYGYGLVVYNVTSLVVDGINSFTFYKTAGNVAVYPSSLIVLVNNPASTVYNNVYIVEEADLLSKTYNKNLDAIYSSEFSVADGNATLYVFAAGAQAGEGNIVVNGEVYSDVWSGTSQTFDVYQTSVDSGNIAVDFVATGSTILALHQMVVVENVIKSTSLDADDLVMDYNDGSAWNVTLTDENGDAIEDATVVVTTPEGVYYLVTDADGVVSLPIDLAKGTYEVNATFEGYANYQPSFVSAIVTVNKAIPSISILADNIKYGEDLIVNVELSSGVSRRAIVTVDEESKYVTLTDGVGSVKFSGLAVGTHTITASYNGDGNYGKLSTNATVKVSRGTPDIQITASNIKQGEDLVVNVQLPSDVTRRALVTVGDESKYVILTDGEGSVKFSGLAMGTYTITVSYNGDANYGKLSANKTVKVTRGAANIVITANPVTYGDSVLVCVELANATRRVNVTIDGVSKLVTLTDGVGFVEFSGLAAGTHTIVASYSGDSNYAKTTVNATVKVNKATPEIQVTADNITHGEALTVNVQLPADVAKRATVTIGNQSKMVTLKNGTGSIKFTGLDVGTYDVVVSYAGDTNYKKASITTTIEVKD